MHGRWHGWSMRLVLLLIAAGSVYLAHTTETLKPAPGGFRAGDPSHTRILDGRSVLRGRSLAQGIAVDVATADDLLAALRDQSVTSARLVAPVSLNTTLWRGLSPPLALNRSITLIGAGRYTVAGGASNASGLYTVLDCAHLAFKLQLLPSASMAVTLHFVGLRLLNHLPSQGYLPSLLAGSAGATVSYLDSLLERGAGLPLADTVAEAEAWPQVPGQLPPVLGPTGPGPWCPPSVSSPSAPECLPTGGLEVRSWVFEVETAPMSASSAIANTSGASALSPRVLFLYNHVVYGVRQYVDPACVAAFGGDYCIAQLQARLDAAGEGQAQPLAGSDGGGELSAAAGAGIGVAATLGGCLALLVLIRFVRRLRDGHRTLTMAVRPPGAGPATTLLITDILNSTNLWEALPTEVMNEALRLHHRCLRGLLLKCNGYESATEGDSFILAFHSPLDAARFALMAQAALMDLAWPTALLEHEDGCEVWAEPARPKLATSKHHAGGYVTTSGRGGLGSLLLGGQHGGHSGDEDSDDDDASVMYESHGSAHPTGHSWLAAAFGGQAVGRAAVAARRFGPSKSGGPPTGRKSCSLSRPSLNERPNTGPAVHQQQSSNGIVGAGASVASWLRTPSVSRRSPNTPSPQGTGTGMLIIPGSRVPHAHSHMPSNSNSRRHWSFSDRPAYPPGTLEQHFVATDAAQLGQELEWLSPPPVPTAGSTGGEACAHDEAASRKDPLVTVLGMLGSGSSGRGDGPGGDGTMGVAVAEAAAAEMVQLLTSAPHADMDAADGGRQLLRGDVSAHTSVALAEGCERKGFGSLMGDSLLLCTSLPPRCASRGIGASIPSRLCFPGEPGAGGGCSLRNALEESDNGDGVAAAGRLGGGVREADMRLWMSNSVAALTVDGAALESHELRSSAAELIGLISRGATGAAERPDAARPPTTDSSGGSSWAAAQLPTRDGVSTACTDVQRQTGQPTTSGGRAVSAARLHPPAPPAAATQAASAVLRVGSGPGPGPVAEGVERPRAAGTLQSADVEADVVDGSLLLVPHAATGSGARSPPPWPAASAGVRPLNRNFSFGAPSAAPVMPSRLGPRISAHAYVDSPGSPSFGMSPNSAGAAAAAACRTSGPQSMYASAPTGRRGAATGTGDRHDNAPGSDPSSTDLAAQQLPRAGSGNLFTRVATADLLQLLVGVSGDGAGRGGANQAGTFTSGVGATGPMQLSSPAASAPMPAAVHGSSPTPAAAAAWRHSVAVLGLAASNSVPTVPGRGPGLGPDSGAAEARQGGLLQLRPSLDMGSRVRAQTHMGFGYGSVSGGRQQQPGSHLVSSPPQLAKSPSSHGLGRMRTQAMEMMPVDAKLVVVRQTWRQMCASMWPLVPAGGWQQHHSGETVPRGSLDVLHWAAAAAPATLASPHPPLEPHPEDEADEDELHDPSRSPVAAPHTQPHHHLHHMHHHSHHFNFLGGGGGHGGAHKAAKGMVLLFRGFRVRMGLHTGIPLTTDVAFNHTSGHMAYSGAPLKIAKAVGDGAPGGAVLLSNTTFNMLHPHMAELSGHPQLIYCGDTQVELIIRGLYMLQARELEPRLGHLPPIRNLRMLQLGNLEAPVGTVAVCFMMVVGATKAVAELGRPAVVALQQFKSIVTGQCCQCSGYVVEATDGLCLSVFMEPAAAAIWALRCKEALMQHPWSREVLGSPHFGEVREFSKINRGKGLPSRRVSTLVGAGPRIKTGIACGPVTADPSSVTCRLSYRGKVMNRSARVAAQAAENQVLLSSTAWQRVVATAGVAAAVAARREAQQLQRQATDESLGGPLTSPFGPLASTLRALTSPFGPLASPFGAAAAVAASSAAASDCTSPIPADGTACHQQLGAGGGGGGGGGGGAGPAAGGTNALLAAGEAMLATAAGGRGEDGDEVEELTTAAAAVAATLPALPGAAEGGRGYVLLGCSAGVFSLKGLSQPLELFELRVVPADNTGPTWGGTGASSALEALPSGASTPRVASRTDSRAPSFLQPPKSACRTVANASSALQAMASSGPGGAPPSPVAHSRFHNSSLLSAAGAGGGVVGGSGHGWGSRRGLAVTPEPMPDEGQAGSGGEPSGAILGEGGCRDGTAQCSPLGLLVTQQQSRAASTASAAFVVGSDSLCPRSPMRPLEPLLLPTGVQTSDIGPSSGRSATSRSRDKNVPTTDAELETGGEVAAPPPAPRVLTGDALLEALARAAMADDSAEDAATGDEAEGAS